MIPHLCLLPTHATALSFYWLRWDLANCLLRLVLAQVPPHLCLPSSWDYNLEYPVGALKKIDR
jgi:hypothetical protein